MGQENESANKVANAVAEAVTDATATTASVGGDKESKEAKLDAQAELFIRKITDNVTKAMADLLKPPVTEDVDDDTEEDSPVRRKRRNVSRETPKPAKSTFWASIGLG